MGSCARCSLICGIYLLSLACGSSAKRLGSNEPGGAGGASDAAMRAGAGGAAAPSTPSASAGQAAVGGGGALAGAEGGRSAGGMAFVGPPEAATVTHTNQFSGSAFNTSGLLLATDPAGNIFAVGQTGDPATARLSAFPEGATEAIVVAKYAPTGSLLSLWSYPGPAPPEVITVTPSGTLVIIGQLPSGMDFGVGILPAEDLSYYVVWLDGASGEALQQQAVPHGYDAVWLRSATSDAAGNIYVAGELAVSSPTRVASAFVSQFLASGAVGWSQVFPGCDSTAVANDIELTPAGKLAIGGAFNCTLTVGAESMRSTAFTNGYTSYNGFVAELSQETGEPLFSMRFGGQIYDMARTLDVAGDGHYRILGVLSGESEVGGITVDALEDGSYFVADLDPDGTANWVELIEGGTVPFGSVTSQAGVTYVAGHFEGTGADPFARIEGSSSFVLGIGPSGGFGEVWTAPTELNRASEVAMDGDGGLWVSGELLGSADLGLGTLSATDGDSFLVRLDP